MSSTTEQAHPPAGGAVDWSRGHYERTAAALVPAAEAVVRAARLHSGESAIDVGCGTGTVAMLAAQAGARVTGVDPAPRLLDVARVAANRDGLDVAFFLGEAGSLPVADGVADAVLSNFALIFAPAPEAAVAEMVRVMVPGGRIVFTAWLPGGAIGQMNALAMELVRSALGAPPPAPGFAWHDPRALTALFAKHEMVITMENHELVFTGTSPTQFLEFERISHPMAIAGFDALQLMGRAQTAQDRLLEILTEGNEDPDAFRATARYVVVTAQRA